MKLNGLRILLAEDNPTNQLVALQMLEALGAETALACDGVEAIEMLEKSDYDLALIDIEMPRKSGIEVIKHMRANAAPRSEMPLIALTAYVMREHREPIMDAGADGIIAKPIASIEKFGDDILRLGRERRGCAKDAGAPVDPEFLRSLAESIGDEEVAELLAKASDDLASAGKDLDAALEKGDLKGIAASASLIHSVSGAIGATGLQQACEGLGHVSGQGDLPGSQQAATNVMALLGRVGEHIAGRRLS